MLKRIVKYLCLAVLIIAGLMSIIASGDRGHSPISISGGSGSGK